MRMRRFRQADQSIATGDAVAAGGVRTAEDDKRALDERAAVVVSQSLVSFGGWLNLGFGRRIFDGAKICHHMDRFATTFYIQLSRI